MKSLCAFTLAALLAGSSRAGSLEQVPPTPADLARELGLSMTKFTAKFEEPVYLTIELRILGTSDKEITILEQVAPSPSKVHELSLTLKDMDALYEKLGLTKAGEARGALDISIAHPQVGFTRREKNPFGALEAGQSFVTWSQKQSMEELELGRLMPIYIKAGPFTAKHPRPKDLVTGYESAPAYIWLGVKFTKDKPAEDAEAPVPDKKPETPKKDGPQK